VYQRRVQQGTDPMFFFFFFFFLGLSTFSRLLLTHAFTLYQNSSPKFYSFFLFFIFYFTGIS
jgi:hypothetical protein